MAAEGPPPFHEATLIAQARERTGLSNFGDEGFRNPLRMLLDALAKAPLNAVGTTVLRSSIRRSLVQRLLANDWLARHPEIEDECVDDPIVVVGMMRSGTTLIQRLLARDPRLHCAYGWELGEPSPRRGTPWATTDPRVASGQAKTRQMQEFAPALHAIHPTDAMEADEEIVFLADAFLSHVPEASCHVPAYRSWIDRQDFTPAYRYLKRMLQFLQWQKRQSGGRGQRWILKTPAHLGYLDTLFEVFPDARIVHMHRHPIDTIPSGASLNYTLWQMYADEVDPFEVGRQWIERMAWATRRGLAVRDERTDQSFRFVDVQYGDAVEDPIGQVERIYEWLGTPLVAPTRDAMALWLDVSKRDKSTRNRYTAEQFGLTEEQIRETFTDYIARFIESPDRGRANC